MVMTAEASWRGKERAGGGVGGWGMWGVWEGGVHNSSTEQLRGNMTIVLNNIVAY
jgi:hypothetical protein